MSAAFRHEQKKKYTQHDLRRLMNEQKATKALNQSSVKIDSPLAKYNDQGQLSCILCQSVVRSENVWKVHINSKTHKENIALAKELKQKTQNFTETVKRPATPPPSQGPPKKLKGILKNSITKQVSNDEDDNQKGSTMMDDDGDLSNDFFDGKSSIVKSDLININRKTKEQKEEEQASAAAAAAAAEADELPEGFFDDPKQDAKAHNREFKDPAEEEWEKFQKEIKEAQAQATEMINEEQEEATNERQIEEIDEQLRIWSKVVEIEKKTEALHKQVKSKSNQVDSDDEDESSDENMDVDEFLDWRAKKSHK